MNNTVTHIFIVLSLAFLSCKSNSALTTDSLVSSQWTEVKSADGSTPIARHEAAFIGIGQKFYLLGGRDIRPVSIFDTQQKSWTQGQKPPIELHHFQPVIYKNEVYILGAMTGGYPGETPVEDIYVYNPTTDTWRIDGSIPPERARGGAGAVVDGDNLYLVCGIKDGHRGDHKSWLDRYNFKTKTWEILPDAPRARDHFQAAIVDEKIYVLAGRTTISSINPFKHTIGEVNIYDMKTNSWSNAPHDLPTYRAGNAVHVLADEILIIGGESFTQELAHSEVEALDTKTLTWRSLPPLSKGRHGTGIVQFNNKLYTASGCGNRGGEPELNDLLEVRIGK